MDLLKKGRKTEGIKDLSRNSFLHWKEISDTETSSATVFNSGWWRCVDIQVKELTTSCYVMCNWHSGGVETAFRQVFEKWSCSRGETCLPYKGIGSLQDWHRLPPRFSSLNLMSLYIVQIRIIPGGQVLTNFKFLSLNSSLFSKVQM